MLPKKKKNDIQNGNSFLKCSRRKNFPIGIFQNDLEEKIIFEFSQNISKKKNSKIFSPNNIFKERKFAYIIYVEEGIFLSVLKGRISENLKRNEI